MSVTALMPDRVTIKRPTITKGATGGQVKAWHTIAQDVKARRVRMSETERMALGKEADVWQEKWIMEPGADIESGDEIWNGDARYQVSAPRPGRDGGGVTHYKTVYTVRIN